MKKSILIPSLIFTFSFLLLLLFFKEIIINYYPSGDEFSLIVNSCKSYNADVLQWFTNGFYNYFLPYPEWMDSSKTILRPAVNFVFFLNDFLFNDNYGRYLLFTYFIHSLSCAFVFILSVKYLKQQIKSGIICSALMFINPSIANADFFFNPGFAFDALIAVCFFLCFHFSLSKKNYSVFILIPLLFFSLLTKEIAVLLPFLISLTLYIKFRKKFLLHICGIASVVLLYTLLRNFSGFEILNDSSLEHFKNVKEFGVTILKSVLIYPAGFYSANEISQIFNGFYPAAAVIIVTVFFILIPEIINLVMMPVLIIKRKFLQRVNPDNDFKIIFIWASVTLAYLMLMGLDLRFSYTFYLFFIPLVFFLFKLKRIYKILAGIFLFCFLISNLIKFTAVVSTHKETNISKYEFSRQLVREMKSITNDAPVILINDVSALFGSNLLNRFCNKKNEVIKLNSLDFSLSDGRTSAVSDIKVEYDSLLKISIKNNGGRFLFEGVNKKFNHTPAAEFNRNDSITYHFPEEQLKKITSRGKYLYDFGSELDVKIQTKNFVNILYFNASETKYSLLKYH